MRSPDFASFLNENKFELRRPLAGAQAQKRHQRALKSARRRFEVLFMLADEEQRKRSWSGMCADNGVDVVHDELGAAEALLDFAF